MSSANPSQPVPQSQDVVLGGTNLPPTAGLVLGGLEGIQRRCGSSLVTERLAAIAQLTHYGQVGVDLLIQALQDESTPVQRAAYLQLQGCSDPKAKRAVHTYDHYRLFECLFTLRGHAGGVTAVAVSADGKTVVSAGRDATLRVWDLLAQEVFLILPVSHFVYAIAISSDHQTFTTKHRDQMSIAWDLRTGQQLEGHDLPTRTISSVTTSPNRHRTRQHLFSGSRNTIKIWDLQQGQEVITLQGHTQFVTAVAITPNESLLVSGSDDKTLKVWGLNLNSSV